MKKRASLTDTKSPMAKFHKLPGSEIKQQEGEKNVRRPHVYSGKYADNMKNDSKATATLKDGTTRVGPWEKGKPVEDSWSEKDHPLTATATAASCAVASSLSSESGRTISDNPPLQERDMGVMLSFSTPNQAENVRREQQELEASGEER
jgi:hypothetical protein